MSFRKFLIVALPLLLLPLVAAAQKAWQSAAPASSADQDPVLKKAELFLRNYFAWGPDYKLKLGPLRPATDAGFYTVPVELTFNDQTSAGEVYVSKDGKTLVRGDMFEMAVDPFAENRAKLHTEGNPAQGAADAAVTVVEFGDLECPTCRATEPSVKFIKEQYKIRFVFKDFPLKSIHPWAETAAIGARCAYIQSPDAFWKVHDALYENQDAIKTENITDNLVQFATGAGLDVAAFKACLSSNDAKKAVEKNRDDGIALDVNSTPTFFINGRPVVGGDLNTIEHLIDFETAGHAAK